VLDVIAETDDVLGILFSKSADSKYVKKFDV
jgi:hypothetical protein